MYVDRSSGLILPFRRCGACKGNEFWQDFRGVVHCWRCVPPQALLKKLRQEAKAKEVTEQRAVDDFLDEDDDIQDFNEKHFGVRMS